MRRCRSALVVVALSTLLAASAAPRDVAAQEASDKDRARDLAKRGIQASRDGRHDEAITLLTEAEALFHAPTHLLYLARSHAASKHLLEAQKIYEKLVAEQLADAAPAAFVEARSTGEKELEDLRGTIPRLVVRVEPAAAPGLEVKLGDRVLSADEIGAPIQLDPGKYALSAKATGLKGAQREIEAMARQTVDVTLALATGASTVGAGTTEEGRSTTMTVLSFGSIGLGVAGLGVGTALSLVSLGKRSDADALEREAQSGSCDDACRRDLAAQTGELDSDANLFGNLGIVGLAAGGALVATGLVLFFTSDGSSAPETEAAVMPLVGPGFVGVQGRF